ncbi:hypothetical protein F4777DRAFT_528793 [Nemania sp. FL0916]|nr:hypothetical protein F4777DRAFT_528793 [Nemania sp. FL0916]
MQPSPKEATTNGDPSPDSASADLKHQLEEIIRNNHSDKLETLFRSRDDLLETSLPYELKEDGGVEVLSITLLALAAALGKTSIVEYLLEQNANVNSRDPKYGETALHLASRNGHIEVVDLLLSRHAAVNLEGRNGLSPLHLAARYARTDIAASLLDAKANLSQRDNNRNTPFITASLYGQLEALKLLWERGSKDQLNEANIASNGPLHVACYNNRLDTVKWLLSVGAAVDKPGMKKRSSLILACEKGYVEVIEMLLNHGADLHRGYDSLHQSPILWSCYHAQLQSLKTVLKRGALVRSVDDQGNTCFHKAVFSSQESPGKLKAILDELISAGADIDKTNIFGHPPLYVACRDQKPDLVKHLVDLGANIDYITPHGSNALVEACCKPNSQIVNLLLERKADVTITNNHGLTALALACKFNRLENVKALLKNGAKPAVYSKDRHTPLYNAAVSEHIEVALELLATLDYYPKYPATEKAFTEYSINTAAVVKIEDKLLKKFEKGKFPESERLPAILHWAIANGALTLAQQCISHDPQVLSWERNGATWLHIAAQYGQTQLLQPGTGALRVEMRPAAFHGTNVRARAEGNITALHVAVVNANVEIARLLLEMLPAHSQKVGAIMDRNTQGESSLTISIKKGCKDLEELFWAKISELGATDTGLMESDPAMATQILELLAQYEIPGHEVVLNKLLQLWFRGGSLHHDTQDFTTLDWAVNRAQVPVLWWLLSKGGYSSGNAIAKALRLVPGDYPATDVRHHVKELLLQPPAILDAVANPDTGRITLAPAPVDGNKPSLQIHGNIVDIYSNDETINIPYKRASVRDIVYDRGPKSLMMEAKEDLSQRDLNALKTRLRQHLPDQGGNTRFQHDDAAPGDELSNGNTSNLRLRWIHLPVNELQLMRDLVCRLSHDSNRLELDHSVLMKHFNRNWTELAAGGKRSYMKPQCVRSRMSPTAYPSSTSAGSQTSSEGTTCTALYMPYLTVGNYKRRETDCGIHGPDQPDQPVGLQLEESMNSRNLREVSHKPMTLDQYYYPTITDTNKRDGDQVVSRILKQEHGREMKILMVNSLWIWIIDEKTIITATAEDPDQESKSNLLRTTLDNILYGGSRTQFERATTVESVMEFILGVAIGSFMGKSIPVAGSKKGPIEIFRESIRTVTNEENELFEEFLTGLKHEAEQSGILLGKSLRNRRHVISSETKLLQTTRDICDELQILRSLAEDQDIVWKQAFSSNGPRSDSHYYHSHTPVDIKKELDEILLEAEQTTDYIGTLLDLRQAEYSRIQAQDSARQANSIIVFTFATIIFLPLSFLSSLFALDVSTFPHQSGELKYEGWFLFPILFGVTAVFSIPALALAWNVNAIATWFWRWTKDGSTEHQKHQTDSYVDVVRGDVSEQQSTNRGLRRRFGIKRRKTGGRVLP